MRFVSIDVETTGLDPERHCILEIGAVAYDFAHPTFREVFHYFLDAKSLLVNVDTLKFHLKGGAERMNYFLTGEPRIHYRNVMDAFANWARKIGVYGDGKKVLATGKNFGSFDLQFIKRLPFCPDDLFHHRTIDVGTFHFNPSTDSVPPSLDQCLVRANVPKKVSHTAVDDAEAVALLIHKAYGKPYNGPF
jgi:oligoribonuclease